LPGARLARCGSSARRSPATWTCSAFTALGGGSSPQIPSMSSGNRLVRPQREKPEYHLALRAAQLQLAVTLPGSHRAEQPDQQRSPMVGGHHGTPSHRVFTPCL
jgi:hypothetical protein